MRFNRRKRLPLPDLTPMILAIASVLSLFPGAMAAELSLVEQAEYLNARGHTQAAVAAASAALEANPDDLRAHEFYVAATSRLGQKGRSLEPTYRAWHNQTPTPAASYGLALAIHATATRRSMEMSEAPCAEVDALLSSMPESAAFEAQWARWKISTACGWEPKPIVDAVAELDDPRARALYTYDQNVRAELGEMARVEKRLVRSMASYLARNSSRRSRARLKALAAAVEPFHDSDHPLELEALHTVLQATEDPRVDAVREKLEAMDAALLATWTRAPDPSRARGPSTDAADKATKSIIWEAGCQPTHTAALEGLDAIADELPADGPMRALWQQKRADHLQALGRADEAYAARWSAAEHNPKNPSLIEEWGTLAVERSEDLDALLVAIDQLGPYPGAFGFKPSGWDTYATWMETEQLRALEWDLLRGRALLGVGRHDEAVDLLSRAAILHPGSLATAHLGLALLAADEPQQAFAHLARVALPLDEPQLTARVEAALAELYPAWGGSHPQGQAGYLAQLQAELDRGLEATERPTHERIGEPLPVPSVKPLGPETDPPPSTGDLLPDEVYAAHRSAAEQDPTNPTRIQDWGMLAVERGEDLDAVLVAIDQLGPYPGAFGFQPSGGDTYATWVETQQLRALEWDLLRGRALLGAGRQDEGIAVLNQAAILHPGSRATVDLGLALLAADEPHQAFAHLARVALPLDDPQLTSRVEAALAELYPAWGTWHPQGQAGYLAQRQAELDRGVEATFPDTHELVGAPLPVTSVKRLGPGRDLAFPASGHITVVNVWASWCGPCVAKLPKMQSIAKTYAERGVMVYGLSVDNKRTDVLEFFEGASLPEYPLGLLGPEGFDLLALDSIPAVFLVGTDGRVVDVIRGFSRNDTRLEAALDSLLLASEAP